MYCFALSALSYSFSAVLYLLFCIVMNETVGFGKRVTEVNSVADL